MPDPPQPSDFVQSVRTVTWLKPDGARGGEVFTWADSAGDNNFVSARDRPHIVNNWLDGQPGVEFDGALKQVLRCGCFTGLGKGSKPVAFFVASVNADHPVGTPTLFYLAGKTPLVANHLVFNVTVGSVSGLVANVRLGSGGTASNATASPLGGYANGQPRLFMAVASNAVDRAEIWEGNVLRATAAAGASGGLTVSPTHAVIGSGDEGGGATRWFDGVLGDVVIFDGMPPAPELAAYLPGYYGHYWRGLYAGLAA